MMRYYAALRLHSLTSRTCLVAQQHRQSSPSMDYEPENANKNTAEPKRGDAEKTAEEKKKKKILMRDM